MLIKRIIVMFMRANVFSTTNLFRILSVIGITLIASGAVFAVSESELRRRSNQLQGEINEGEEKLNDAAQVADSFEEKVNQLQAEINSIEGQINSTKANIAKTQEELTKTEAELERQENIMNESMRALYKQGRVSTIELLASSNSFTEFVNGQEYIERVKLSVQESAKKVADLKEKLETQKEELNELLELQTGQRKVIAAKKAEQDKLLADAKATESSYASYVKAKENEQNKIEAQLEAYIRAQIKTGFQSQGKINSNSVVGYTGSTGNSTGVHLHFGLFDPAADDFIDPVASRSSKSLKYGFSWPYNTKSYPVTRWFDCTQYWAAATRPWCPGAGYFHRGVDIAAPQGTPVRSIGGGDVLCSGYSCVPGGGNTAIIRHNNGMISYYHHML